MKVPQYIKDSIYKSALHRAIANEENIKIREWLDKQGLEDNRLVENVLIDDIENSYNPNKFIEFLEKEEFKK